MSVSQPSGSIDAVTFLAVDDRPDNLFVLNAIIRAHFPKSEVITASSAMEGLRIASKVRLDGILADVQMPEIDGVEMCRRIKSDPYTRNIPFFLVTSHESTSQMRTEALRAGADDFIAKPIDNEELIAKINVMLRIKRAEDSLRAANTRLEELVQERTKQLVDNEDRFRTLLQSLNDVVWASSADGSQMLYINPAVESVYGHKAEEFNAFPGLWRNTVHPDDARLMWERRRDLATNGHVEAEYRIIRPDGQVRWIHDRANVMCDASGEPIRIGGIISDITERKLAEFALRDSEEEITAIYESAPVMMLLVDSQNRVCKANRLAEETMDSSPSGMLGKRAGEVLRCLRVNDSPRGCGYGPHCLSCPVRAFIEQTFATGESRREVEANILSDAKGAKEILTYLLSIAKLIVHGEPFVLMSVLDITERKRMEAALRESEERYRGLVENVGVGVALLDANMNILAMNRQMREWSMEMEDENVSFHSRIFNESSLDSKREDCPIAATLHDGQTHETIRSAILKGGVRDYRVLASPITDAGGKVTAAIAIVENVTERVKAVNEQKRLATALEQAAEAVVVFNVSGDIEYTNPAFETLTGLTHLEVCGKNWSVLRSPKHDDELYRVMQRRLLSGKAWKGRLVNIKKDGAPLEVEAAVSSVRDASGAIINFVAVCRDTTRETQLENQLIQSQKMEAIGTLAGGIAHDFNNILQALMGFADLASMEMNENPTAIHYMDEIRAAANRAADLVRQILAFSRKTARERGPVGIRSIVQEVLKLLRGSLPSTIEIRQELATCGEIVLGDPSQLHQLIMNLATNAFQAMREHGGILQVHLNVVEFDQDQTDKPFGLESGRYVQITISDTGCGIESTIIDRIFEPYFTTKTREEGTGLGLAMAHGIVKDHGGAIRVESEVGKGTTFDVFLPIMATEALVENATVFTAEQIQGTERVLLVDDEPSIVQSGRRALESLGYEVVTCTNGSEAIDLFEAEPNAFDVVVTDQTMPRLTGLELARGLLKIRSDIPIILCTGYSENVDEKRAIEVGIRRFIMKPITREELGGAIREVIPHLST
jgi:PAS domain S-box-containing protein